MVIEKPMRIDPWGSQILKDYDELFKKFGISKLPEEMRTSSHHFAFERNIVIGHRDFEKVFKRIQDKQPFINMTGIASSGELHFGHKVILDLFSFFKKCGAKNYLAICDIDGYVSRPDEKVPSLKKAKEFACDNLSHALALGLDPKDVYVQSRKEPRYYEFALEISKKITANTFKAIYGHLDPGKLSACLLQYADILHPQLEEYEGPMPSITVIGFDQDPHIRATRDLAQRLPYNFELPSVLFNQHLSGLQAGIKMSKSVAGSAIFLSDIPDDAAKKIMASFDGGRDTAEEQRKLGGQPHMCKVYEFMKFNYESSKDLKQMYENCITGKFLCNECKLMRADFVRKFMEQHHKKLERTRETARKIIYGT